MKKKGIYVTQPFLPPLDDFKTYLDDIWESKFLTNNGKYHQELEEKLAEFLGVKYISLFSNGTLALITAIQSLKISGEVITTPFSFVATTHSLWWNNIKPVFADIESGSFNVDPERIESAITPKTSAILPVHVYGYPCNTAAIKKIADTFGLKVIYDACHAFGVEDENGSVLKYGDLSILSFHATKVFTTFEGGAIICHDETTKKRIDFLKNFGFADETTVVAPGINAKMNEFQAALGVLQLKYFNSNTEKRKRIAEIYRKFFSDTDGIVCTKDVRGIKHNYSYFPVLINEKIFGESRDDIYNRLKKENIFTRRYFYPLISTFPAYRGLPSANPDNLKNATEISRNVLCLPIYPDLDINDANRICELIMKK